MTERATTRIGSSRFLAFRVAGRRYALPAETVSEIVPVPAVARLPHSPKSLLGLANLRGAVIPVVSLGALLGLQDRTTHAAVRAIVLGGAAPVALPVDTVETLDAVDAARVETRQAELAAETGETLLGAYHSGTAQDVTKILDLPALLAAAFGARSAPAKTQGAAAALAADARAAARPGLAERAGTTEHRLLISFEVARQDYALPLDAVREITPVPETISVVPRAESVLLGITAWRGALLPLLSLRTLLGFPRAETPTGREKVVIIAVQGAIIGLVADRALALVRADIAAIDAAPAMLAARSGGESKITAIYRSDGGKRLISLLAPEQLFREDIMHQVGGAPDAADTSAAAIGSGAAEPIVVFRLGNEKFGLPIAAVDEVARVPAQVTRVPKMPKFLAGLVNLRGAVLPVVDQRRRFGMPAFDGTGQRLIVVQAERHRAGLIVDSVSEVLRVAAGSIQPPPDLADAGGHLVTGVINAGDGSRMILLLDPAELLTGAERRDLDRLDLAAVPDGSEESRSA